MRTEYFPSVKSDLDSIRLMGDMVLVKPDQPEFQGLIYIPPTCRPEQHEMLYGVVVKCGPGDRLIYLRCAHCGMVSQLMLSADLPLECSICGVFPAQWTVEDEEHRRSLDIKVGDRILYWRANAICIGDEMYQLLHEQQHVVAVLEQ